MLDGEPKSAPNPYLRVIIYFIGYRQPIGHVYVHE